LSSEGIRNNREINYHGKDIFYQPKEDYIEFSPRKVFGGKKKVRYTKKSKKELVEDYKVTISSVLNKHLKDENFAYFVLEFQSSPTSRRYYRILKEMNMTLLAFMDKQQKKALVQSPYAEASEVIVNESRDIIKNIRPLDVKEKLAPDLTNIASEATVIINTIPNVSPEKIETHMTLVKQFIQGREGQPIDGLLDRENRRGSVIARVKGQVLSELANESSVVLSIYRVPKVILSAVKKRKQELKQNRSQMIVASSLDVQDTPPSPSDKYEVVEIDSGVKMIQEFQSHVTPLSALPRYADGEDKDDHGTPIASLILFGEGARASKTRLRVTSYKGWQKSGPYPVEDLYTAFKYVLDNYHGKSRVFVSSLNYEFHDDFSEQETRKLELLLQSKNICFVNSAGNICDAIPRRHAHESRESIWKSSKVFHPSDARTVISVGACCRENNLFDHSFNFYPACFSRHSSDKIANKPEVLEYGGTHEVEGFANHDKGVLAHSITGTPKPQFGTSMAAPLFARHLALLDWSLGSRVKNCETLRALAYSACKMTAGFDDYCGFGVLDPDELSVTRDMSVRIIFEGRFENMSEDRIPVHELNIPIPVQPVKVTLYLVHSDNYFSILLHSEKQSDRE
jgi:hypothetical protein